MVEIHNFKDENGPNGLTATFELYLPNIQLTFKNLKLIISKTGKYFVRTPSFVAGEDFGGKKDFQRVWSFPKEKEEELAKQIEEALQVYKPGITISNHL